MSRPGAPLRRNEFPPPRSDTYRPYAPARDDRSDSRRSSYTSDQTSQPLGEFGTDPADKMDRKDSTKACSEIAELSRQINDLVAEKSRCQSRLEFELKGFKQREADYKKSGGSQFPAVGDAFKRHQKHYEMVRKKDDIEIEKIDALLEQKYRKHAELLVKALPVGEMKSRQLVDMARAEMEKVQVHGPDERYQRLEQQVESLKKAQDSQRQLQDKQTDTLKAQATALRNLKKENEEQANTLANLKKKEEEQAQVLADLKEKDGKQAKRLADLTKKSEEQALSLAELQKQNEISRSRSALHDKHASDLAALEGQCRNLLQKVDSLCSQQIELQAWKRDDDKRGDQISELHTQLETLLSKVDSKHAELADSLQKVQSQRSADVQDSTQKAVATLEQKVDEHSQLVSGLNQLPSHSDCETLSKRMMKVEAQVAEFDRQISTFDATEYQETVDKVLTYPAWDDLHLRIQATERNAQQLVVTKDGLQTLKKDGEEKIGELTRQIVRTVSEYIAKVEGERDRDRRAREGQFKAIERRAAAASRPPSFEGSSSPHPSAQALANRNSDVAASDALSNRVNAVVTEQASLRSELAKLREEHRNAIEANETMILNLDKQFQNLTTQELAHEIIGWLKGIPPSLLSADVQNLHERLVAVEGFTKEQKQKNSSLKDLKAFTGAAQEALLMSSLKRGRQDENVPPGQEEKRQRMNGTVNGYAVRQNSFV